MGFTKAALDLFISEKIGQITVCGAKDVAKEFPVAGVWVSAFGLCVIFQNHPPEPNRQFALQFVRRIEAAFSEYSRAVENLEDLVNGGPGRWSPYFRALYHLEAAITQLYLAYDGTKKKLGKDYFKKNDGTGLANLNKIYNASKHETPTGEQTLWITNDGISATTKDRGMQEIVSISFGELEELLRSYASLCDRITNQADESNDEGMVRPGEPERK